MASIFENSSTVIRPEVDLLETLPTDTSIERSQYIEFNPTTNVQDESSQIEFVIPDSSKFYRDLQKSFLYIVCQIVKENGSTLPEEPLPEHEYVFVENAKKVEKKPYVEPSNLVAPVNN